MFKVKWRIFEDFWDSNNETFLKTVRLLILPLVMTFSISIMDFKDIQVINSGILEDYQENQSSAF